MLSVVVRYKPKRKKRVLNFVFMPVRFGIHYFIVEVIIYGKFKNKY